MRVPLDIYEKDYAFKAINFFYEGFVIYRWTGSERKRSHCSIKIYFVSGPLV